MVVSSILVTVLEIAIVFSHLSEDRYLVQTTIVAGHLINEQQENMTLRSGPRFGYSSRKQ